MLLNRQELYRCMDEKGLEYIVGTMYQNVFYLTDYFSPNPFFLSSHITMVVFPRDEQKQPILIISKSEAEMMTTSPGWVTELRTYGDAFITDTGTTGLIARDEHLRQLLKQPSFPDAFAACADALKSLGATNTSVIGIDERGITPPNLEKLTEALGTKLIYASDVIGKTRLIKTAEEVRRLKKAVNVTEESIRAAMEQAWVGMTEKQLLQIYYGELVRRGAEPMLNPLAFGSHAAHANAQATDYIRLEPNRPIRFDIGCTYEHYFADTARIAVLGRLTEREYDIFDTLRDGMAYAIEMIQPGRTFGEVFRSSMERMQKRIPNYRRSHIGHGIGVEVYDPPMLGNSEDVFREGMVMCIEAPYYEVGLGGYQVEEVIHVTKNGAEVLSGRPVGIMEF